MQFYRGKLKRLLIIGGIALSLTPCLQQTHALCRLVGCAAPATHDSVMDLIADTENSGGCCDHESSPNPKLPRPFDNENLPCGSTCWCCQQVDPREAPRNATESAKSVVSTIHACAFVAPEVNNQPGYDAFDCIVADLQSDSAVEVCVRLCRFLT